MGMRHEEALRVSRAYVAEQVANLLNRYEPDGWAGLVELHKIRTEREDAAFHAIMSVQGPTLDRQGIAPNEDETDLMWARLVTATDRAVAAKKAYQTLLAVLAERG